MLVLCVDPYMSGTGDQTYLNLHAKLKVKEEMDPKPLIYQKVGVVCSTSGVLNMKRDFATWLKESSRQIYVLSQVPFRCHFRLSVRTPWVASFAWAPQASGRCEVTACASWSHHVSPPLRLLPRHFLHVPR